MNKTHQQAFGGTVLFLGYGAVAQCTLPLLMNHLQVHPQQILIIEQNPAQVPPAVMQKFRYVQESIHAHNLHEVLTRYIKAGDIIIDLAYNIDCCAILDWCHKQHVLYLNTSVELWDPYLTQNESPEVRTLYPRHMAVRRLMVSWQEKGATAVLEHGANPGLVSHFTKKALLDIAQKIILEKPNDTRVPRLKSLLAEKTNDSYPMLAQLLGVKVIHISERDTQISNVPKLPSEFVNTWSVQGLHEEGVAPAEMGWGTHEKTLPKGAYQHAEGPKNQICLAQMGIETWMRSWVPSGNIMGMIVRHGEAFTISDYLTVWQNNQAVYRPTVHYVYHPCDAALNSLHELKMNHLKMPSKSRILRDEITQGVDEVGVLLMGHDFNSWWTGSVLSIEQARTLAPHQNATTLQVAASVVAAVIWMIRNPTQGICVPDDLPHEEILDIAVPYLGDFVSQPYDWTPLKNRVHLFKNHQPEDLDLQDPWQFKNFYCGKL